MSNNISKLLIS